MSDEPDHPLLQLLRNIRDDIDEIHAVSDAWAKKHVVDAIDGVKQAMAAPGFTLDDLSTHVVALQNLLRSRHFTKALADIPEANVIAWRGAREHGSRPADHVPLPDRIANEIDLVRRLIQHGKPPAPPIAPAPPPAGSSEESA